ncbi:phosphoribosylformylglycinamidine synthase subunit PurQ [Ferruginivarius sediminum]|uniref:Phosphoribosylformylglycinamidine synthase subunit PurQ n=1 Tax=Ferruginivarius sediminum TaxID=2661937 RepID=A0A369T9S6_9PROT|nr:phosphoribosylformylglycinamidine synthase subunit PurQ [Ferruginivarius sediminum]RDD61612.1 phosphoribosylformylglycinamidine synthase subunit PurQ [Ferruginivarius sediminum]
MKAAVVVFPGSNCDRDVAVALERAMGRPPVMVWHKDSDFEDVDLVVLPGGFSYGDYLRVGAISAHANVMREVKRRAGKGVPVLGICNGFQVLTESGLLPGALMRNKSLRFVCKDVGLKVETGQSLFTSRYETGQRVTFMAAHHDGSYFIDDAGRRQLEDREQIAFRYCDERGQVTPEANPNGSVANIAGIFNSEKTVLGMMPHPERMADPVLGGEDGRAMFEGLVEALS